MSNRKTGREGSCQAEKSEQTRVAVMEAAVRCYIKKGYAKTTVLMISDEAGVTRGAPMHHFGTRLGLVKAAVAYICDKRLAEYQALISETSSRSLGEVTEESMRETVDALWEFFHLPSYVAYQELLMAARTDKELAKIIDPTQAQLNKQIKKIISELFPAWSEMESTQQVLMDLFFFCLQGIAMSNITSRKQVRVKKLLDHLVQDGMREFELSKQALTAQGS